MEIKIHRDIEQGTDAWLNARLGLLTASRVKEIITPAKLQFANNEASRSIVYELAAERVTQHRASDNFQTFAMARGHFDEVYARQVYERDFSPVEEVGFITRDLGGGVVLGYSPDGMVDHGGLIEIKSRTPKLQFRTIIESTVPREFMMQIQTGILVAGCEWCDFVSYSAGMPMYVERVYRDDEMQQAIRAAAVAFEEAVCAAVAEYAEKSAPFPMTERIEYAEDMVI